MSISDPYRSVIDVDQLGVWGDRDRSDPEESIDIDQTRSPVVDPRPGWPKVSDAPNRADVARNNARVLVADTPAALPADLSLRASQ
jgi:hypothetical protein